MADVQSAQQQPESATLFLEGYGRMLLIRLFENSMHRLFLEGEVHGTTHLSIGEEATPVGALAALRSDDYITSTHRGHGHCIAKGADLNLMEAELLGRETGYCRGRGGSMHIADVQSGNLGANGVVGGGIPVATGVGLSMKLQGLDRICLCFFGDGAANEGTFHESINLAATWDLPVVYLCENNQYGLSMSTRRSMRNETIAQRSIAYGIPGDVVDGNDVFAVYAAVYKAAQRARSGKGPTLLECRTYRYKGHSKSDQNLYRTRTEIREWQQRDPIQRLIAHLTSHGLMNQEEVAQVQAAAYQAIEDAYQFAISSPMPDPEQLLEGVYA